MKPSHRSQAVRHSVAVDFLEDRCTPATAGWYPMSFDKNLNVSGGNDTVTINVGGGADKGICSLIDRLAASNIGRALRLARYHAHVSQADLARAVSVAYGKLGRKPVTQSFICRVEKSRGNLSVFTVEVICGCLGYAVGQVWEIADFLAKSKGKSEDQLLRDLRTALKTEFAELRKERDLVKDVKAAIGVGVKVSNRRKPSVK
jgi:transcriptional regulator with XRE-family HTH domain